MIITRWILTLEVWGSLIWLIIIEIISGPDPNSDSIPIPSIVLTLSYLVYFVFEFASPFCKILLCCSKTYSEYISNFIEAAAEIKFMNQQEIFNGKKLTYLSFPYFFSRDIGENLILEKGEIKGKYFLKLYINREIFSDDNDTLQSFNQEKNKFYQRIRDTDGTTWVDIWFKRLKTTVFLNNENKYIFLNATIFIIFALLALGEIYQLIVNLNTEEKTITIKKIIKNTIIIPIIHNNENKPQIPSETNQINNINSEVDIVVHNNENKLNDKNNDLKKTQKGNELNRNSERENVLKIQK